MGKWKYDQDGNLRHPDWAHTPDGEYRPKGITYTPDGDKILPKIDLEGLNAAQAFNILKKL